MGFNNINGPTNKPVIQASQNLGKDGGGGGNTGYMNMRGKKKKKEDEEDESSVFFEDGTDTFVSSKKQAENQEAADEGPSGGKKFLVALAKFIQKKRGIDISSDSFEKQSEEDNFQEYIEIEKENTRLTRQIIKHPPEEDEYEIVDNDNDPDNDDDYYDGIDV